MPVTEGGQHCDRVMADAGQDDPFVGDSQPCQVEVKVLVVPQGLVPVAYDQPQARAPGKGGCVLFRIPARAHCPEAVLAAAIDVPEEVFRLDPTGARGVLSSVSCIGPAPIMDTLRNSSG